MKNTISILGFKNILILIALIAVILTLPSCQKDNAENSNCSTISVPDILRFNIVNKNTGENLFFSTPPVYTANQIHFVIDDMPANISPKIETSTALGQHFTIQIGSGNSGILKAYIAGKLEYTIQYTVKELKTLDCPKNVLDKVIANGNQVEENVNGRVILLKL